ncbi:serpin family protein [Frigoriglobus tundricola]|uniref:Serine protease inhibitor (Serpin family) n=1 Tax=Frigoriglobus tundricola TaxID=2774151 RepID=A0A6M5YSD6_9BACT|nr:serpin family protein [Frigoriglobus tundricola]QJW95892.1 Serine protease inhibitor (serpin family) [Frigoriglobus tundricola]
MPRLPLLVVLGVLSGLTGCRAKDPGPPVPWSADMQAVADGNNQFAFDLYAKLCDREKGNLFFSPYSAHTALAMTATGARGTTRDEMVAVLHLPTDEQQVAAAGDLARYYAHPRKDYELSVANAIWGQKGFPWRPEFLNGQTDRFGSGFQDADFATDPDGERQRINQWAAEKTRDQVKELVPPGLVTKTQQMVLANAIYFKGAWQSQFDPKHTTSLPFTLADATTVPVPMMRREGGFRHYAEFAPADQRAGRWEPEFQVAELPYKGAELSMVVLVPGTHDGLPALEARLSAPALDGWLIKAQNANDTGLYLPKFKLETGAMMMREPLQALGMRRAFDPAGADFTGMHTSTEALFVNFVVQKAFVDVNEEGTEAAAATAVGLMKTAAKLDFRADRPFLFLIRDVKHGT